MGYLGIWAIEGDDDLPRRCVCVTDDFVVQYVPKFLRCRYLLYTGNRIYDHEMSRY